MLRHAIGYDHLGEREAVEDRPDDAIVVVSDHQAHVLRLEDMQQLVVRQKVDVDDLLGESTAGVKCRMAEI